MLASPLPRLPPSGLSGRAVAPVAMASRRMIFSPMASAAFAALPYSRKMSSAVIPLPSVYR